MIIVLRNILFALCSVLVGVIFTASAQPNLLVTEDAIATFKSEEKRPRLFDKAYNHALSRVKASIANGIDVPMPKDPGGGVTHERHKENYKIVHDAGLLYLIDGDMRYVEHARDILLAYAEIYKELPLHPERKNQGPGKLFWQSLNESVWLVYTIQGYNAIADALDADTRTKIETNLLLPVAEFLSTESPELFRRIHNHGTWAAAAVGMTGYALKNRELVDRAIMGLDGDGSSGFLAQMNELFSPDGYYTEGPYYQRYALMPFVLFAQAIEHNDPERKIFEYRDHILPKAIETTIQLSYNDKFFPINDAIREKGLDTIELVYGVSIAYGLTQSHELLSIAKQQGITVLTKEGYELARAIDAGNAKPFEYTSRLFRDGANGDQGGLAVMRMGDGENAQTLVVKNTSQGMGHGHFDKLSYQLYDNGSEIVTDYGAARFLNVPSKNGGRYLPENQTWAKQTVAHNTLVVNETSHFAADWREGQKYWPEITYSDLRETVNIVAAKMQNAYEGVTFDRTIAQLNIGDGSEPIVVDIVNAKSEEPVQFDLPFYFDGQLVHLGGQITFNTTSQKPLGKNNGYQHLWLEAFGPANKNDAYTWLKSGRFYTNHVVPPTGSVVNFVRTGANDPNFNLRQQQGFILRAPEEQQVAKFISVIEPHGVYDPSAEFTIGSESSIHKVEHHTVEGHDLVTVKMRSAKQVIVAISNDPDVSKHHKVNIAGNEYSWTGFYKVFQLDETQAGGRE
jgi:hypothetical protein